MILHKPHLLQQLAESLQLEQDWNQLSMQEMYQASIASITTNQGTLHTIAPVEKHPYIQPILSNPEINAVMVGTFPPISYLCDTIALPCLMPPAQDAITPPAIPFFHGNLGSLWQYALPNYSSIMAMARGTAAAAIQQELTARKCVYTDIIQYCQRDISTTDGKIKYTASDDALCNIEPNSQLLSFLATDNQVSRIYFTNSCFFTQTPILTGKSLINIKKRDAFALFVKAALDAHYQIELHVPGSHNWYSLHEGGRSANEIRAINSALSAKVHLQLRLTANGMQKQFDVVSAISPAAVDRGRAWHNPVIVRLAAAQHISLGEAARMLLKQVLSNFFANNIPAITAFNA